MLKTRRSSSSGTPGRRATRRPAAAPTQSESTTAPSPSGSSTGEIAGDAAAGDVRESAQIGPLAQCEHVVEVEPGRRQQELRVDVASPTSRSHEREPVRVHARRREADHDVAGLDARAVDQPLPFDDADAGAAEVDLLLAVDTGKLGRLATEDRASCRAADVRSTLDEVGDLLGIDRVGCDVVEKEERLGAGGEDVVDAVRRQIGTAPAQLPGAPREHELGANRIGGGGEHTSLVDGKAGPRTTERALDARGRGGRRRRHAAARRSRRPSRSRRPRQRTCALGSPQRVYGSRVVQWPRDRRRRSLTSWSVEPATLVVVSRGRGRLRRRARTLARAAAGPALAHRALLARASR